MTTVIANGKPRSVADGASIVDLLTSFGWKPEWVVVERNGEPVERHRLAECRLFEGDRLEIVRPVAGGAPVNPDEVRARLAAARLYLVTDGRGGGEALREFLDAVLPAGVDVVQLREKQLEAREILTLAETFRESCDRYEVPFIVNDRADVAFAAGADGVHLGQDDLPVEAARRVLGRLAIIGRSTHDVEQLRRAEEEEIDYLAIGPVYETPTKPGRPAAGLDLVRVAALEATKPWFAIGGIDAEAVRAVREAGARRVAVVRAITLAEDPALAVKALRAALDG